MEMAEDNARLMGMFRIAYLFVSVRAGDLRDRAPEIAVDVRHPIFAGLRLDDLRELPDAVRTFGLGLELRVTMVREHTHVLHDDFRVREDRLADALHDKALLRESRAEDRQIGVVDVA